jgi:hypothetical protein
MTLRHAPTATLSAARAKVQFDSIAQGLSRSLEDVGGSFPVTLIFKGYWKTTPRFEVENGLYLFSES